MASFFRMLRIRLTSEFSLLSMHFSRYSCSLTLISRDCLSASLSASWNALYVAKASSMLSLSSKVIPDRLIRFCSPCFCCGRSLRNIWKLAFEMLTLKRSCAMVREKNSLRRRLHFLSAVFPACPISLSKRSTSWFVAVFCLILSVISNALCWERCLWKALTKVRTACLSFVFRDRVVDLFAMSLFPKSDVLLKSISNAL